MAGGPASPAAAARSRTRTKAEPPSENLPRPQCQPDLGRMIRLCRHNPDRQHRPRIHTSNPKSLDQRRQHQNRLGHGELRPDTDPRPGAERQEREPSRRRLIRHEPRRAEHIRLRPQCVVPVQHPRRDHDQRPTLHLQRADPIGPDRLPDDGEGGRKQPQRLIHHRPRTVQRARCDRGRLGIDHRRRRLLRQPVLFLRRRGQHDQRPEQRHRGRFMPGEDQGSYLIAQLRRRKPRAGLRVARRAQQIEQIARGHGLRRRHPRRQNCLHQHHPALAETVAPEVGRRRDRRRQQHVQHPRRCVFLGEFGHHPPHGEAELVRLQREHRARGNIQRQALHRRQQIDRLAGAQRQPVQRRVGGGGDVPRQHRHHARRQRRGDGAALQLPVVPLAQQQSLAGDRAQDADRRRRAPGNCPDCRPAHGGWRPAR